MGGGEREGPAEEPPQGRGPKGPDPATRARAAQLRAAGKSNREIGTELGVAHTTVARMLAGGPPGRGPGRRPRDADPAEVKRLREQKVTQQRTPSWREIGARLGISHETARQRYASKEAAVNDLAQRRPEDDLDRKTPE